MLGEALIATLFADLGFVREIQGRRYTVANSSLASIISKVKQTKVNWDRSMAITPRLPTIRARFYVEYPFKVACTEEDRKPG